MTSRAFFCSLLVMSERKWLRPEELKFEVKEYFFYTNIDRTTIAKLANGNICTFSTFPSRRAPSLRLPFNNVGKAGHHYPRMGVRA